MAVSVVLQLDGSPKLSADVDTLVTLVAVTPDTLVLSDDPIIVINNSLSGY